jgi:hypothetical protein
MDTIIYMKSISTKHIFVFLFAFVIINTNAQTWKGTLSSDWNTAGNWNPANVPGSTSFVTISGTGITNWPVLSGNINVGYLNIGTGAEMDTKGFEIRIGQFMFNENCLFDGATIKNSSPNTTTRLVIIGTSTIGHSTFEGNIEFTFSAYFQDRFNYSTFFEYANHFKGNAKFNAGGNSEFYISNDASTFDAGVEINFDSYKSLDGNSQAFPVASLFYGGSSITGNLKINSPGVAETDIGGTQSVTVSGNADVTQGGDIAIPNNLSISGSSVLKIVGSATNRLFQNNPTAFSFKDLTVDKTAGQLTLSSQLRLSGKLSLLSGNIQNYTLPTSNGILIFLDGATWSGASDISHLTIPVQKIGDDAFTFPVGSATKLFSVQMSAPSTVTDNFSASFVADNPTSSGYDISSKAATLSKVYADGFWDIKRINGSSNVNLTLGYELPDGYITNQSSLRVAHWDGAKWENLGNGGTTGNVTSGSVKTASPVSSFSPFTLASLDAANPLPVKLIAFTLQNENELALLQWRTAEEINSNRFEIEHSSDAVTWLKIGEVTSMGNSREFTDYKFVDDLPVNGLNYYRLKMVDDDATFAYSKIESLHLNLASFTVLYPNPASQKLFIKTEQGNSASKVEFYNTIGERVLHINNYEFNNGIDLKNLATGTYTVNVVLFNGRSEKYQVMVTR